MPIVLPVRIDAALLDWIYALPWPVVMVIHSNHPNEINEEVRQALLPLRQRGVHLLNQAVLLKGVNASVGIQVDLSRQLFDAGVLPYYLHCLDRVQGAAHFEVSDAQARTLYSAMQAE